MFGTSIGSFIGADQCLTTDDADPRVSPMDFHQAERYLRGALLLAGAIWSGFIAYDNRAQPLRLLGSALVALILFGFAYFAIGSWPIGK